MAEPNTGWLFGSEPHIRDVIYGTIEAGFAARAAGRKLADNPHTTGTYFASLWQDGWREAEFISSSP